jgi:predicted DNA binding CopG/RHH family protein
MKKKLKIPQFKNEDAERDFWARIDFGDYAEPEDFVRASFPNLKPTSHSISIRIPDYVLARVREQANSINIPYQSLMKQYIAQGATGRHITRPRAARTALARRQSAGQRRAHSFAAVARIAR